MHRMLAAKRAVLVQLQLLSRRTLVLVRRVVLPLAIGTSQTQQITHIYTPGATKRRQC